MGLKDDLEKRVAEVFRTKWDQRDGNVVPGDDSLTLGNDAVKLKATVLYADLADSTKLVDGNADFVAAEIYKTFLHCAANVIRDEDSIITAYDGDRIMAVYIGDRKNSRAVKSAMKIHYAVLHIINPAQQAFYTKTGFTLKHVVGVDTSELFVAKTGVRGANDLVWVGRAANYAAKLSSLPDSFGTYITKEVFDAISMDVKTSADSRDMWEAVRWNTFDDRIIYRSNWWWRID
ncbi:MAG: adenylate/guanylate cyclase domain-containing protein [Acidobacteriaceae bacterium]